MTSFDTWPPIGIASTGAHAPHLDGEKFASSFIAVRRALEDADVLVDELDLVVVTGGPGSSAPLGRELELGHDVAMIDFAGGAGGFIAALHVGASMLAAGEAWTYALVVEAGVHAGAVVLRKELEVADIVAMAAIDAGVDPGAAFDAGIDGGPLDEATPGLRAVTYAGSEVPLEDLITAACRDASVDEDELVLVVSAPEGTTVAAELDRLARSPALASGDLVCLVGIGDRSGACVLRWA
jgi:hypothetical protein